MLQAGVKCLWLLAMLAGVLFSTTVAQSKNSSYTIMDIGNEEFCGAYLQWRSHMEALSTGKKGSRPDCKERAILGYSWMAGFITAYNRFGPGSQNVAGSTDAEGMSR